MIVPHDELSIHQDVPTEDECRHNTVDQLDRAAVREERRHEPEDDEHPERAEEIGHPACEVVFGLAGEQGQGDEDTKRENKCFDHNPGFVEGRDDADGVGFEHSEAGQEE